MAGIWRIVIVALVFTAITLPLLPLQLLAFKLQRLWYKSLPHAWQRAMCRLLGLKVTIYGRMETNRPLLLVSNHVSWSDILVLGSLTELSFISKSEVRNWPLFGVFAKLQRTVFIERERRHKTGDQTKEIAARLHGGDILVLFAEGTTSDGNSVLPFKSALLGAAKAVLDVDTGEMTTNVTIQPVSLAYTRIQGLPIGRFLRPLVAWPGTVPLIKHLKGVLGARAIDVEVTFGDPVTFSEGSDRKALSRQLELQIRAMTIAKQRFYVPRDASLEDQNQIDGAA